MKRTDRAKGIPFAKRAAAICAAAVCAAALCLAALPLAGCFTEKHGRRDIEKYVRDKYGIEDFTVSSRRTEVPGLDDSYIDYLWTVSEDDGTVFNVLDDYYYGTEWTSNSLTDNRGTVHMRECLKKIPHPGLEAVETAPRSRYIDFITLKGSFASRAELDALFDTLDAIARELPESASSTYSLEYAHRYRRVGKYEDTSGDTRADIRGGSKPDRAEAEEHLLHCALDLRYESVIAEFTDEEIRQLLEENYVFKIGIKRDDGSVEYYDDLIESRFYYGISFPSMYEVLVRSGYPVEGSKDEFSFTGADGSVYEFSLDFMEEGWSVTDTAGKEQPIWYYYIKDGEQVPMDAYFYNHFSIGMIEKLTGIRATDGYTESRAEKEREQNGAASGTDAG